MPLPLLDEEEGPKAFGCVLLEPEPELGCAGGGGLLRAWRSWERVMGGFIAVGWGGVRGWWVEEFEAGGRAVEGRRWTGGGGGGGV